MKLLFFSSSLSGGGAERVLVNITKELSKRGHSVTIALNSSESDYEIDSSINLILAPHKKWYKGRNLFRRFFRNIEMSRIHNSHTKKAIQSVKPDVIITFLQCNMWPILRHHGSIPIIHSEHNAYDRRLNHSALFKRFVLNRFYDRVFVLTSFDQGYAKAKGIKNTMVMPNPNTYHSITDADYYSLFPYRKNILMVGRIDSWHIKGMDIAINAFAKIANGIPGIDMDIVGSGNINSINYLNNLAIKKGVGDRIHFLGYNNNIRSTMQQHLIYLLTSRTEGFPMVITEAMSQGLPCVSFERLASAIIVNGIDGLLVNDGDIKGLEHTLINIINDDEKRKRIGIEGLKNVQRFSAETIAIRWEESLQSLINNQ